MAYNIPLMNKSFDLLGPYLFINYLIKPILFQIVFSRKMDNLFTHQGNPSQNHYQSNEG